jgi:CRP-like cAMP-binding protein
MGTCQGKTNTSKKQDAAAVASNQQSSQQQVPQSTMPHSPTGATTATSTSFSMANTTTITTTTTATHAYKKGTSSSDDNTNFFPLSPPVIAFAEEFRNAVVPQHLKNIFALPLSQFPIHLGTTSRNASRGADGVNDHNESKFDDSKTTTQKDFLRRALQHHYLFQDLSEPLLDTLIAGFEMIVLQPNTTLIQQGDIVDHTTAYFYVVYHGRCSFSVMDTSSSSLFINQTTKTTTTTTSARIVGYADPGDSFGELALLYDCPRAATVTTLPPIVSSLRATFTNSVTEQLYGDSKIVLFRVHQCKFRNTLRNADITADQRKIKLLENVSFLKHVSPELRCQLAEALTPRPFAEKDVVLSRGQPDCHWFLIERGTLRVTNILVNDDDGNDDHPAKPPDSQNTNDNTSSIAKELKSQYQDVILKDGDWFGERAIITGEPTIADVIAESSGLAFTVDKETFLQVVGKLEEAIKRSADEMRLRAIEVLAKTTQGDTRMISYLASQIKDQIFSSGDVLWKEGQRLDREPALYLVRKGSIKISRIASADYVEIGIYHCFGEDQMFADSMKNFIPEYTVTVSEDCTCGILNLSSCRRVLDTIRMGTPQDVRMFDSLRASENHTMKVTLKDLKLHKILGAGTFGQVWLASRRTSDGVVRPYALKVQSKHELLRTGQVKGVIREKNIMAQFHNPFLARLVASFQDDDYVYMLMTLIQGGELYTVMRTPTSNTMTENIAK